MKLIYIILVSLVLSVLTTFFLPVRDYNNLGSVGEKVGWPVSMSIEQQNNFGPASTASVVIKYVIVLTVNLIIFLVLLIFIKSLIGYILKK
jgi:hypothetical protein